MRQELADHIVEGPAERYRLDWPGKREAAFAANAPEAITLRPVREESVDFDTTQNLFIEGDNLQALKLLQDSYLGKVKLIYIDPPYNTGNDFIYNDAFAESSAGYLERSTQRNDEGAKLVALPESDGRFHSKWLSMMYPRLKLARNLLSDDGVIAVSIDDTEGGAVQLVGRELFGDGNFIATVVWKHTEQSKNDEPYFSRHHNYLVLLRRSSSLAAFKLPRVDSDNAAYSNPDNDPNGPWRAGDVRSPNPRPTLMYKVTTPSGRLIDPPTNGWRWSKGTLQEKIARGEIVFREGETRILRKIYLRDQQGRTPETVWNGDAAGTTREANAEIKALFGSTVFDTPKPTSLVKRLLALIGDRSAFVLDFFAGSSTTAHAVMAANAADGGNRRFVMVQLDEATPEDSAAREAGYGNIAELSRERIRRAGAKIKDEAGLAGDSLDVGFRTLKVDSTNYRDVRLTPDNTDQTALGLLADNIKADRTPEDLLFEVMIDWGVDLALPIERVEIAGADVFIVDSGCLIACFAHEVSDAVIRGIAERQPAYAVFRDSSFASDDAQINAKQIFTEVSPDTALKVI